MTPDVDVDWQAAKRSAVLTLIATIIMAGLAGILYGTYLLAGLLATVVYTILFLMALTLVPLLVALLGSAVPWSTKLGRGHYILGAFAYHHVYLVDMGTKWELCPGRDGEYYLDGEWYEIDAGEENMSILGWRPFGVFRHKTDATYQDDRVDEAARKRRGNVDAIGDGGQSTVERGGYRQARETPVSGLDDEWLLDLKRIFTRGVRQIGDIRIIETAEEIIERGQRDDSTTGLNNPAITIIVTLVLGLVAGGLYVYFMGGA